MNRRGDWPAFPFPAVSGFHDNDSGLSIREEFAARMLAAILAKSILDDRTHADTEKAQREWRVKVAIQYADTLLDALAKPR